MKRQDLDKYHHASVIEIQEEIKRLDQQYIDANMKMRMGELKNLHQPKQIRQDIARLKTIIRAKELGDKQEEVVSKKPLAPKKTIKKAPVKKAESKKEKNKKSEVKK